MVPLFLGSAFKRCISANLAATVMLWL